ncbi:MAG: phosphate ABC transporter permease subunit PstC [Spirochaetota bacterium]
MKNQRTRTIIRKVREFIIERLLFLSSLISVFTTVAIIGVLFFESFQFFTRISPLRFLTELEWTPLFFEKSYGIWPLIAGTFTTSFIAMCVAIPFGLISAIYLSEYASPKFRTIAKPILEMLAAIPTVVYGYFALLFITPLLKNIIPGLPTFNALSAGIAMGVMIIPIVASLSEDAMRSVPIAYREGGYALGATRLQVSLKVVFPAALSGITAALILAVSRAVGETMIVAIAAGQQPTLTVNPLESVATITAYIVQVSLGDTPHGTIEYSTIFVCGLTLFVLNLILNMISLVLKKRFQEFYE